MTYAIGIDLGGTNIKAIVIDEKGREIHRLSRPTEDERNNTQSEGTNWKNAVKSIVHQLKTTFTNIQAIGLAAPGIVNADNTAILNMPGRMFGLDHFHWANFLEEERVPVLNDAHAALIAEYSFGVGRGYKHVAILTLGTGIGGGLIIDGKLHQGFIQRAGHLGHISVEANAFDLAISNNPGALELAIGDFTVKKRSFGRFKTTHQLVKAYEKGDTLATYVWLQSIKNLAVGISSILNAVSPELIILAGGMTKAGDSLFKPLASFMEIFEWRAAGAQVPIKPAFFSDYAGAIGAASYALEEFQSR